MTDGEKVVMAAISKLATAPGLASWTFGETLQAVRERYRDPGPLEKDLNGISGKKFAWEFATLATRQMLAQVLIRAGFNGFARDCASWQSIGAMYRTVDMIVDRLSDRRLICGCTQDEHDAEKVAVVASRAMTLARGGWHAWSAEMTVDLILTAAPMVPENYLDPPGDICARLIALAIEEATR